MTMCGARAVPEPWSATTGFARWNSATPPVVSVFGLVWFARTLIGVAEPSASTVCGSTPVLPTIPSPRYPMMPGTPLQLLSLEMRAVFVQS